MIFSHKEMYLTTESTEIAPARHRCLPALVSVLSVVQLLSSGCSSPSAANNKLRAENLKLQDQITSLQREKESDRATIQAKETMSGTIPTLPQERLDKLFTAGGLKLGRLTGGDHWTGPNTGDDGIKVEAVPLDQQGEKLKAAGSFVVELFDLSQPTEAHVGHWSFNVDQSRQNWYGGGLLYSYILKCPWQKAPVHADLTLKVTFTDELTGREFTQQQIVKVHPPTNTP